MELAVQPWNSPGAPHEDHHDPAAFPAPDPGRQLEIHVLGPLRVRRTDGTEVGAHEWRTGKTADLMRLLALHVGRPIEVPALLERLWPDVDESRGRASLRTAASQIRRAVHSDCIRRRLGGLVLDGAWVDTSAFESLATAAADSMRTGDHVRAVVLAQRAEALYADDFHACDDYSSWAQEVRETLLARRRNLLTDAAEAALHSGRCREGAELARLAIRTDPLSEGPHRSLMLAYAGLGETEKALRTFERLRSALAEELGVDPSPSTCEVNLQVLRGEAQPAIADAGPAWGIALARHIRDFFARVGPVSSIEVHVRAVDQRGQRVEMVAGVARPGDRSLPSLTADMAR